MKMTKLTQETFIQGWSLLEKHYRRDPATKELLKLYYGIFKELTDEQFHEGVRQTLLNERFLPPLQTIIDYGKALTKSLPLEHRLFIAPAEDNYDPESMAMIEARKRARGIVRSVPAETETDLTEIASSQSAPPTEVVLNGLAGLLEKSGSDAVQQRLEMLSIQGVDIKMSAVLERHTRLYGDDVNLAKLGNMLNQKFLTSLTNINVDNVSEGGPCQN